MSRSVQLHCKVCADDRLTVTDDGDGEQLLEIRQDMRHASVILSPENVRLLAEYLFGGPREAPIKTADLVSDAPAWQPVKAADGAPAAFVLKVPGAYFYAIDGTLYQVDLKP